MRLSNLQKKTALTLATLGLATAAVVWQPAPAKAAVQAQSDPQFYATKVLPILQAKCYRCHGGMNHRGGLSLETRESMLKGGHDGSVIVPGHPEQSLLVKLIRHEGPADDPMPMPPPPKEKLSDADIAVVAQWVKDGAVMP